MPEIVASRRTLPCNVVAQDRDNHDFVSKKPICVRVGLATTALSTTESMIFESTIDQKNRRMEGREQHPSMIC